MRREKGASQAQLALAIGISPSYLNLIEHNRRRITVNVLLKLAQHFGVDAAALVETEKSRLVGDLMDIFGDDMFGEFGITNHDVQDVAVSNPKVGQAVLRLFDNYLAIRKSGVGGPSVLIDSGQDVASDAVSDFLQQNVNYFPTLELAANRVRKDIDLASEPFVHGLKAFMYNALGLRWRTGELPEGKRVQAIETSNEFVTSELLPSETALFLAAQMMGNIVAGQEIDELLDQSVLPGDATAIARDALSAYFAAALIMPYEAFYRACLATRYDIERLERLFNVSFEQICHRMTTLQRPGLSGIPIHFVRTDIAGNISKRFSLSGIRIPRHSGACPRWNIYSAFLHPDRLNVQISEMPDGERYLCIAKAITKGGHRYNAPRSFLSVGVGCHITHASALIYSDGLELSNPGNLVAIGVGCRVCSRCDCEQRAHPNLRAFQNSELQT
jgi:XRE family transcriptional regulator, fatty acid utilization regulator